MTENKFLISQLNISNNVKNILIGNGLISIDQLCNCTKQRVKKITALKGNVIRKIEKELIKIHKSFFDQSFVGKSNSQDRAFKIIDLYRKGHTLQEIGGFFEITRERVRQIINSNTMKNESSEINQEHYANYEYFDFLHWKRLRLYLYFLSNSFSLITEFSNATGISIRYLHKYFPEIVQVFNNKREKTRKDRLKKYFDNKNYNGRRESVLKNYDYKCIYCGLSQEDCKKKFNKELYVFHKNMNKVDNKIENLAPLCVNCFFNEMRKGQGNKNKISLSQKAII